MAFVNLVGAVVPRAIDTNGDAESGALLYVWQAGTSTAVTTYSDIGGTTPNTHPVVANSAGAFGDIYVDEQALKIDLKTSGGVSLPGYPIDNVRPPTDLYDDDLAAIAGLTSAADRVPYYDGPGSAALAVFTAAGRSIVGAASVSAAFDVVSPVTTEGDIIYRDSSANARLAIGTAGQVLAVNSGATAPEWVDATDENSITRGTTTTLSGTAVDWTSLPASIQRLTLNIDGASMNGTAQLLVQLGDATTGGFVAGTSYQQVHTSIPNGSSPTTGSGASAGMPINISTAASSVHTGTVTVERVDANDYLMTFVGQSEGGNALVSSAVVTLAGDVDRIRLTSVAGTATFDAGQAQPSWEIGA